MKKCVQLKQEVLFSINVVNDAQWKPCEAVTPTRLNTRAGFMQHCDKKDTQVCKSACVCARARLWILRALQLFTSSADSCLTSLTRDMRGLLKLAPCATLTHLHTHTNPQLKACSPAKLPMFLFQRLLTSYSAVLQLLNHLTRKMLSSSISWTHFRPHRQLNKGCSGEDKLV